MSSDVYIDIEANGLEPTHVHCVGVKCVTGLKLFRDRQSFKAFLQSFKGATIYAHNGIGYDYPVLSDLWGVDWHDFTCRDTLVLSRLAKPARDGGHSLANWGDRLGMYKGSFDGPWDTYTEDMGNYCLQDVRVLERLTGALHRELKGFHQNSIELEHEVATIIAGQEKHGWLLDCRHAYLLLAQLQERKYDLEQQVKERFVPLPTFIKEVEPKRKADGGISKVGLQCFGSLWDRVGGRFSRVDYPEFNLGSRQQIGRYLQYFGWKPTVFTPTGQPVVDEGTLEHVDIPEAKMIAEYLMLQKRMAQVVSWIDSADDNNRVHGRVRTNGAVTGRMTHQSPNMAQVPAVYSPYGKECRECWIVPEGYSLVGVDAAGLELRMLAHYMNDPDYTKEVVEGDIHTANQEAAGLETRDQAKTFIYAFLYGAGDAKIGEIVGGSKAEGRRLKEKFLANTPALRSLQERVKRASGRGWLKGLDGRHIEVRSTHAALNTLLQGAGAVVMKQALIELDFAARESMLDYAFVGNIHDEIQTEVRNDHAEQFARYAEEAIDQAGRTLGLRCPLSGEAKIGQNWAATH